MACYIQMWNINQTIRIRKSRVTLLTSTKWHIKMKDEGTSTLALALMPSCRLDSYCWWLNSLLSASPQYPSSFPLCLACWQLLGKWHQLRWEGYIHGMSSSTILASAMPGDLIGYIFCTWPKDMKPHQTNLAPFGSQLKIIMCLKSIW